MHILIRVDASIFIGQGHVMRCLVLARELANRGSIVTFVCRQLKGDLINRIKDNGFNVLILKPALKLKTSEFDADYVSCLQVPLIDDVKEFLDRAKRVVNKIDLVIVDHYSIDENWESLVKKELQCKIFVIDDLARKHSADLILDQTLGRDASEYLKCNSDTKLLLGCENALLGSAFSKKREAVFGYNDEVTEHKILLYMGTDINNITLDIFKILITVRSISFKLTVLISAKSARFRLVKDYCSKDRNRFTCIEYVEDMASLLMNHTIAIGAPGSTSWERLCMGVPSIIIPIAENQKTVCNSLVKANVAISLLKEELASNLELGLEQVVRNWLVMKNNCLQLCDGLGVHRVVDNLYEICTQKQALVTIRRATFEDIYVVYKWQKEPSTRKFSFNKGVPNWANHKTWMTSKLESTRDFFYMICLGVKKKSVGVVRLDKQEENDYLLSIYINPDYYRLGIGKKALECIDRIHPNITCIAEVLAENIASKRLFESAKYEQITSECYIRKPIR